jgi:uncharacterized protein involved in response to NO
VPFYLQASFRNITLGLIAFIVGKSIYAWTVHQHPPRQSDLPGYLVSAAAFVVTWQLIRWLSKRQTTNRGEADVGRRKLAGEVEP